LGIIFVFVFVGCTSRPQTPKEPYPYYEEDVFFENSTEGIILAGTMTYPKTEIPFPTVVLITGTGPHERDSEIYKHKIFLVLSDYLTKNGIAVLRFDKRGTGKSTGEYGYDKRYGLLKQNIQTSTIENYTSDVIAAVNYLKSKKEINKEKIGLIGLSEGGFIAPLIASKEEGIAFIILLAAPGMPMDQLALLQNELILNDYNMKEEDIKMRMSVTKKAIEINNSGVTDEQFKLDLTEYIHQLSLNDPKALKKLGKPVFMSKKRTIQFIVDGLSSPYNRHFLMQDPAIALRDVKCPVLALNGDKDMQVPSKQNLDAIRIALMESGNTNYTIKEIPNINHLQQESVTGSIKEYSKIKQTISPLVLNEIIQWIKIQL